MVYTQALLRYIPQLVYGIHRNYAPMHTLGTLKHRFRSVKRRDWSEKRRF